MTVPRWVPNHLKIHEMCIEAVRIEPFLLAHVPDQLKAQEMYIEAVRMKPRFLAYVPNHRKT